MKGRYPITERQTLAVAECRRLFGRLWRKRLMRRPEAIAPEYRWCWAHPFGRKDWNESVRLARRALWAGKV